jgi:hypothetical protein
LLQVWEFVRASHRRRRFPDQAAAAADALEQQAASSLSQAVSIFKLHDERQALPPSRGRAPQAIAYG